MSKPIIVNQNIGISYLPKIYEFPLILFENKKVKHNNSQVVQNYIRVYLSKMNTQVPLGKIIS